MMPPPVLFLDIDGVLNSIEWEKRRVRPPGFENMPAWQKHAEDGLDPGAVDLLNLVVERTGCLVVVSSTWRKQYPLPELARLLRYGGFRGSVFACTPSIYHPGDDRRRRERGGEIDFWLTQLGDGRTFAIVDDDSDMEPHLHRLVKTDGQVGLTREHADRLIAMLGGHADPRSWQPSANENPESGKDA